MLFRLKPNVGNHCQTENGKDVVYEASEGRIIKSDIDLVKMFPNKFERVKAEDAPVEEAPEAPAPTPPDDTPKGEAPKETQFGRNVTKRFKVAVAEDFLVYHKDKDFTVVEPDDVETPLNEAPLKKAQVTPFIKKYLNT